MARKMLLVILFIFFGQRCANAQGDDCDSVLNLAGREYQVKLTNQEQVEYRAQSVYSKRAQNFGGSVPIDGVIVGGSFSDQASNTSNDQMYRQWKQSAYQTFDSVNGPAVEAWLACKQDGPRVKVTELSPTAMTFDLSAGVGLRKLIKIDADAGISCIVLGRNPPSPENVMLSSVAVTWRCVRQGDARETQSIRILTDIGSTILRLPAQLPSLVKYSRSNEKVLTKFGNCDSRFMLPQEDYPREIYVRLQVYNNGTSAAGRVVLNGVELVTTTGNRPSGQTMWGTEPQEGTLTVPAGIPLLVSAQGGANGGQCDHLIGYIAQGIQ